MAVKTNTETKLIIKVQTGTTTEGKATYIQRNFENVNPSLSEDNALDIGKKLAELQKYPLGSVQRQDLVEIAEA